MAHDDTPRRMGRPPLDARHPSVVLSLRVPATRYDELYRAAQRDRVTMAEYVRRSLGICCRRVGEDDE
jgi:hypothetical protein